MVENQQKQKNDIDSRLQGEEAKQEELQRLASGSAAQDKNQSARSTNQKTDGVVDLAAGRQASGLSN